MVAASGSRTSVAKKQIIKNSQFGPRRFKGPFLNVYTKHNQERNKKALDFHLSGLCICRKWRERGGAANLELWCHIQEGLRQMPKHKADIRQLLKSHQPSVKETERPWRGCIQQRVLVQKSTNQTRNNCNENLGAQKGCNLPPVLPNYITQTSHPLQQKYTWRNYDSYTWK